MVDPLTTGLMVALFIKVLDKGLENVIEAGYDDGAKALYTLLHGDKTKQETKKLNKTVTELAKKHFASGEKGDVFKSKPFLEEVVSKIVDPLFDFDFNRLGEELAKSNTAYPEIQNDIKRFASALGNALIRDEYWGDISASFRDIRDKEEIKQGLKEHNYPVRESEIVSQQITNIDTQINIETFIESFTNETNIHIEKYVEQEIHNHVTPNYDKQHEEEKKEAALTRYLTQLKTYCYNLPLSTLGDDDNRLMDVQLKEVYINLNTTATTSIENISQYQSDKIRFWGEAGKIELLELISDDPHKQARRSFPIPAFDAFRFSKRMILLGGPGSGKSTFAKYLLGQYIEGQLHPDDVEPGLLPVLLNFREISAELTQLDLAGKPIFEQERDLTNVLKEKIRIKVCGDGCQDAAEYFEEHWQNGALFLVLDGLDEVPEEQRARIRQTVLAVEKMIHPQRLLVTCRVRSYLGDAVLPNWYAFTLAALDEEQINGFINIWYNTTAPKLGLPDEQKEKRIEDLQIAAQRPSLAELSENPMLLTTMTLIHQREAVLPDQRVKVYKQAVELLVRRWQRTQAGAFKVSQQLEDFLNKEEKLYPLLELIAYRTHQSLKGDLDKLTLIDLVQEIAFPKDYNLAHEFLEYIDHRSGLLSGIGSEPGKPNLYSFPHRTFQEYLAGCYLASQDDMHELLHDLAQKQNRWYLPVQYAVEYLYYFGIRGQSILRALVLFLNQPFKRADERGQRKVLWAGYIARLLGRTHFENNDKLPYDGVEFLNLLRERLIACFGKDLTPKEWTEAGEILAEIGDPRFYGEEQFYLPRDENLGFVEVLAGKFWMGEDKVLNQVELPTYYLNKFMVTVEQFRHFSEAAKYTKFDQNALKDKNNHPARWITWYDAIKYCAWLQKELIKSAHTPTWMREKLTHGWRITLPSEAEWEKVSRGDTQNRYPWGNSITPEDANYQNTQIGEPSAVGCFPGHGLYEQFYDLSGNLWEWTRSKYKEYPYQVDERESLSGKEERVLRGGSCYDNVYHLRCANRFRSIPNYWNFDFGFRIVLSPPPPGSGPSER